MVFKALLFLHLAAVSSSRVNVGAYYYPWHADDFHRDGGYLREEIGHAPALGEYDDQDLNTIRQHLAWSQQANIGVWITSWWGAKSREDHTIRHNILPALLSEQSDLKIAIHYESKHRLKGGKRDDEILTTKRILDDINWILDNYVDHPNYLHINGRPVLVMYLTRYLFQHGVLEETLLLIRTAGAKRGYNLYLVGDHAFGSPATDENKAFDYLDAITNYDVYGRLATGYAGQEKVDRFSDEQKQWKKIAKTQNCAFIPAVSPGFNDRGVRLSADHAALSRKLTPHAPFGSLFEASLAQALDQVDEDSGSLLFVNSFNEWHEDTQIEPAHGAVVDTPFPYTQGLQYEGYGERYLDILREITCPPSTCDLPPKSPSSSPTVVLEEESEMPLEPPTSIPSKYLEVTPTSLSPTTTAPPTTQSPTPPQTTPVAPVSIGGDPCDDDPIQTFTTPNDGEQKCVWLAARPAEQQMLCQVGNPAYHICEETCGKCFDNCEDDPRGAIFFNSIKRDCLWLSLRLNVQEEICTPANDAWYTCRETCGNCLETIIESPTVSPTIIPTFEPSDKPVTPNDSPESTAAPIMKTPSSLIPTMDASSPFSPTIASSFPTPTDGLCDDDPELTFFTSKYGNQKCIWLAARPSQQEIYCTPSHPAFDICEETCGKCSDKCEDTPGTFQYNGSTRDCLWLSLRYSIQQLICVSSHDAWILCPETCNSCE